MTGSLTRSESHDSESALLGGRGRPEPADSEPGLSGWLGGPDCDSGSAHRSEARDPAITVTVTGTGWILATYRDRDDSDVVS